MGIKFKALINWQVFILHNVLLPCSQEPGIGHCPLTNPVYTFQYYPFTVTCLFVLSFPLQKNL